MSFLQHLLQGHYPQGLSNTHIIRHELSNASAFLWRSDFPDECIFHISSVVNKHNAKIEVQENPNGDEEVPVIFEKVMICHGGHEKGNWSLFLFRTTMNGGNCKRILYYYAFLKILDLCGSSTFYQDGAPPHWANALWLFLDTRSLQHLIGRKSSIPWTARSPDSSPLDVLCRAMWNIMSILLKYKFYIVWRKELNKKFQLEVLKL